MSLEYQRENEVDETAETAGPPPEIPFPFPLYTIAILACMVIGTAFQLPLGFERSADLTGFGKPEFLNGEYWRILTGAVVHGSILHIFMNGYAMYGFGRLMELLTNRAHLALVFVLSAVGGGLLSLYFRPDGLSVGASGGIVGLLGYLVVYAFRRRQFVSDEFRKSLLINIGIILVFGLVLFQIIDNYGHIGGLLTGIVYALIQVPSDQYKNPQNARLITKILGALALATYIAATVLTVLILLAQR